MAPSLYQKSNETFFDQIQLENERNEFSLEGVPSGIWGSKKRPVVLGIVYVPEMLIFYRITIKQESHFSI